MVFRRAVGFPSATTITAFEAGKVLASLDKGEASSVLVRGER
jgi:hypothetical protein